MPVIIKTALKEGWKATKNERFGEVFEIRFIDLETNKILFRYAPKLEDRQIFNELFDLLIAYDLQLVQLKKIIAAVDSKAGVLAGDCYKETEVQK